MKRFEICLLVVALFALFSVSSSQVLRRFELGTEKNLTMKKGEAYYFDFTINEVKPGYDIAIIAHGQTFFDHPELYVSKAFKYPNSTNTSTYYSTSYEFSSIIIPSSDISKGQTYYLGVHCKSYECEFKLNIQYAKEYYLAPEHDNLVVVYQSLSSLVLRVGIPKDDNTDRMLFSVELDNPFAVNEEIHMFINQGNTIPDTTTYDIYAGTAWMDGKAAVIYKGDPKWCTGCNYTMLIQAPIGAKVEFHKSLYGGIINFPFNSDRYDAIDKHKNITYVVDLEDIDNLSNETIVIDLIPYYGSPMLYCHYNTLPDNFADYEWSITDFGFSRLSITPKERRAVGANITKLYITVYSATYATYYIIVEGRQLYHNSMYLGEHETGYAQPDERINYMLTTFSEDNLTLIVNLHQEGDGNADLFVKKCDSSDNCMIPKETIDGLYAGTIKTNDKDNILLYSAVPNGDQYIKFTMDALKCDNDPSKKTHSCIFAITVSNRGTKVAHYSVVAEIEQKHKALSGNYKIKEHVQEGQFKYYYFTVMNDSDITAVSFQLTEISGYVIAYVSRKEKYPNATNSERALYFSDKITFNKTDFPNLSGTYYIGAQGISTASFTIVPILTYKDSNTSTVLKLSQGVPQKAVIGNTEAGYYMASIYYTNKNIDGFQIVLDNTVGRFKICVRNDGKQPKEDFCTWSTHLTRLFISSDDQQFKLKGDYIIGIFPQPDSSGEMQSTYSYTVMFTTLQHFNDLPVGSPSTAYISKTQAAYYRFEVDPEGDDEVQLSVQTHSNTATAGIYLSTVSETLTNLTAYNESITGTSTLSLTLNKTRLQDLCKQRQYYWSKCYLYMALVTNSTTYLYPTISLIKDFSLMKLTESVQVEFGFPTKNHTLHFVYYPYHMEDISILAQSFGRDIKLYGKVIDTRNYTSRDQWVFPTNTSYDYKSSNQVSYLANTELRIPKEALSVCGTDSFYLPCAVLISLDSYQLYPWSWTGECSIVATQEITPLKTGTPVKTSVGEKAYKYFSIEITKKSVNLLISLTALSNGNVNLLVSYGEHARPTITSAEFSSYSGKSHSIQITNDMIYPRSSMKGTWVIGVYGNTACDFTLTALFEEHKIVDIWDSVPHEINLKKGDILYLDYWNWRNEDVKLIMTRETGSATLYINTYKDDQPLLDRLPNTTNYEWKKTSKYIRDIISIPKDDKHFCTFCSYMIGVYADSDVRMTLAITGENGFIQLQPHLAIRDTVLAGKSNVYLFTMWETKFIDIDMVVYSGQPQIYVAHNPTVNKTHHLWSYEKGVKKEGGIINFRIDNTPYIDGANLPSIFDGNKEWYSSPFEFYIAVTSNTTSNFSLTVSSVNVTSFIWDGQIRNGMLYPGEKSVFVYWSGSGSANSRVKAALTLYRDAFTSYLNDSLIRPKVNIWYKPPYSLDENEVVAELVNQVRKDTIESPHGPLAYRELLQFYNKEGSFEIEILNEATNQGHLNYSFVINSDQPFSLPLETFYTSRLATTETDNYAIHVDGTGILVIELYQCIGQIALTASRSAQIFEKVADDEESRIDDPDLIELEYIDRHITFAQMNITEPGIIYIKVTAISGIIDDDTIPLVEAIYKLRANLYPRDEKLPYQFIIPGNDGILQYNMPAKGLLEIDFEDAQITSSKVKQQLTKMQLKHKYDLFVAKDNRVATSLARCDFVPNAAGALKGIQLDYLNSSAASAMESETGLRYLFRLADNWATNMYVSLRVTTYAVDEHGEVAWYFPVVYNTIEIRQDIGEIRTETSVAVLAILVTCIIILIGAIVALMVYFKKYKKVKAKLNYEMQDISNVIIESEERLDKEDDKGKQKYHQLVTDVVL